MGYLNVIFSPAHQSVIVERANSLWERSGWGFEAKNLGWSYVQYKVKPNPWFLWYVLHLAAPSYVARITVAR